MKKSLILISEASPPGSALPNILFAFNITFKFITNIYSNMYLKKKAIYLFISGKEKLPVSGRRYINLLKKNKLGIVNALEHFTHARPDRHLQRKFR